MLSLTKQEEIKEGIVNILAELYCSHGAWVHKEDAEKLLSYLDSQGVVIKVEK